MREIMVNIATGGGLSLEPMAVSIGVTKRPAPKGFHGVPKLSRSIDAKIIGRKTILDLRRAVVPWFSADYSAEERMLTSNWTNTELSFSTDLPMRKFAIWRRIRISGPFRPLGQCRLKLGNC
jgi:hypothetical protein